ncbi:M23 family metallopeptidase [Nocardia cyriacigeorgica]|uniref:M23 family metallopeptidase n=1 Tax=Nocardia cyriacigeorgica TaxID=135487 RepID=UPI002455CF3B|nr:M23 family metallopeptidase [Nocardia cyriacigeorgica]
MNHHTTLDPSRNRSGHRYRHEDGPAAAPAHSGHHGYGFHPAPGAHHAQHAGETQNSWTADSAWNDNASWSEGDAWSEGDSGWSPEWSEQNWTEGETWSDGGAWSGGGETWREADEPAEEPEEPATPKVIPAREGRSRSGGAHRLPAPPSALKGRAAVAAVAAGAFVAAGQCAFATPEEKTMAADYEADQIYEIASHSPMTTDDPAAAAATSSDSPQVLTVGAPVDLSQFTDILEKGQKYAEDLAAQEASKLRPLFARFAAGNFTSGFGARWGVQHLGIDVAGPIGTPIYAVADGTVIEAGPAAGFGMWVRLLHDDGTVTIYGHIDTATVSQGQRVLAGDQIATMGNRGFSTGPHVHFEVWLNGTDKVDPLPWLATRGISLGQMRD